MLRSIDKWLPGYLASVFRRRGWRGTRRLIFCVADHFEPFRGGGVSPADAREAVADWCRRYGDATAGFTDADGRSPRHTCFYPEEEYDAACLDTLANFTRRGLGEVEIHLHHRHDTAEGFRQKLVAFRDRLRAEHGLLGGRGRLQTADCRLQTADYRLLTTDYRLETGDCRPQTVDPSWHPGVFFCHPERSEGSPTPATRHAPPDTRPAYGFVHGNWALCNARPDGDWCGVNEELGILAETGCYADFTFPSAPSPTQPRRVNSIYLARDRPGRPRGADAGERVGVGKSVQCSVSSVQCSVFSDQCSVRRPTVGRTEPKMRIEHPTSMGLASTSMFDVGRSVFDVRFLRPDCRPQTTAPSCHPERSEGSPTPDTHPLDTDLSAEALAKAEHRTLNTPPLLLIQGPLALDWGRRKWGVLPRLENADLSGANPPTPERADLWARQCIHVAGRPDWVFVKVHTHGLVPANARVLLGEEMRRLHAQLAATYNDGVRWTLHYVTAREMFNLVAAAAAGAGGAPGPWRDWAIAPPPVAG